MRILANKTGNFYLKKREAENQKSHEISGIPETGIPIRKP